MTDEEFNKRLLPVFERMSENIKTRAEKVAIEFASANVLTSRATIMRWSQTIATLDVLDDVFQEEIATLQKPNPVPTETETKPIETKP